jgi:hypothetical protein
MAVLDIVGIVETVANSVAICETVLMGMIVADRRPARTPILARNSDCWGDFRARGKRPFSPAQSIHKSKRPVRV